MSKQQTRTLTATEVSLLYQYIASIRKLCEAFIIGLVQGGLESGNPDPIRIFIGLSISQSAWCRLCLRLDYSEWAGLPIATPIHHHNVNDEWIIQNL